MATRSRGFHALEGYTGIVHCGIACGAEMAVIEQERDYYSYMMRLWRVSERGTMVWRASLESAQTGERKGFVALDDMFDYLREQAAPLSGQGATMSEP